MVKGDNKGHKYEKKIVKILQDRGLMSSEISGAGSGPGTDAFFIHKGKKYSIENSNSGGDKNRRTNIFCEFVLAI